MLRVIRSERKLHCSAQRSAFAHCVNITIAPVCNKAKLDDNLAAVFPKLKFEREKS